MDELVPLARSRSPHGERGLKSVEAACRGQEQRRSPHGERGLKLYSVYFRCHGATSLPSWGAWIEITSPSTTMRVVSSRSPHGERGLKCPNCGAPMTDEASLPSWGAWIEIVFVWCALSGVASLPSRGAWIEIRRDWRSRPWTTQSLPSRGAWIEITVDKAMSEEAMVAPLTGSVD